MVSPLKRSGTGILLLFSACVLFLFLLMLCVPLVSDDIEFSKLEFADFAHWMEYVLSYGNGRILGNLGAIVLSKVPLLSALVKALVIAGIIFLVPAVMGIRSTGGYLLSFFLFVSIPQELFGQVYTWTSGFSNYTPPVLMTLLAVFLTRQYDAATHRAGKGLILLLIFLLGVAGQLYVEHCTIINILLAVALVFCRRRNRLPVLPVAVWLAAVLLGAVIMFAVPVVCFVPGNRSEGYRGVHLGGLMALIDTMASRAASLGSALPPFGSLAACAAAALTTHWTREHRSRRWNQRIYGLLVVIAAYFLVNEMVLHSQWYMKFGGFRFLLTTVFHIAPLLLWCIVLFPLENKAVKWGVYLLLCLGFGALTPFAVVSPAPTRVTFLTYTYIVSALLLFYRYGEETLSPQPLRWVTCAVSSLAAISALLILFCFGNILWLNNLRTDHIHREMEQGKRDIAIFEIPYDYVFSDGLWSYGYGYYLEQPHDITFSFWDMEEWYKTYGS